MFRSEIVWKRTSAHGDARKQFPDVTDTIFYVAKSEEAPFTRQFTGYDEAYLAAKYCHVDENGRRYMDSWRGLEPSKGQMK